MRGVDVLSAVEAGFIGMDDPTQLAFATEQGRVLWTFNVKDFLSLHAQWLAGGKSHAGVVLVPQQKYGVGELIRRTVLLARTVGAAEMRNRCEFLSRWS